LLLTESLLLAVLGGVGALLVVPLVGGLVRGTLLSNIEWTGSVVSGRVLCVAAVLTLLTGIVTGLAPALRAGRRDLLGSLSTGVREGGGRSSRVRAGLAIAQAAFSVVLLVGAGLFVHSLWSARTMDLGIEPSRVLTVQATWPSGSTPSTLEAFQQRKQRVNAAYERALRRAQTMPAVASAALAIGTPFNSGFEWPVRVAGWDSIPKLPGGGPFLEAVSSGYFATVGVQLLRGRLFEPSDHAGTEPVAIVNETMAHTLWPNADAVGKCLWTDFSTNAPCFRVVGIVEDAHRYRLREQPAMQYYIPFGQEQRIGGTLLLVRPRGANPSALIQPLRRALHDVDPTVLRLDIELLQDKLDPQFRPWRLGATLIGVFGALALLIAAVGLYSLIAYMVASRVHELGVRLALGASAFNVLGLVLRRGLLLGGGGLALGVLLSLFIAPRIQQLLFRTSPHDPVIYAAVVAVLLAAAVLASLIPARRAARVDPAAVLRSE
jgi:predicted permease